MKPLLKANTPISQLTCFQSGCSLIQSLLTLQWIKTHTSNLVVILPNQTTLEKLKKNLTSLLNAQKPSKIDLYTLPTWESSVYSQVYLSITTRLQRISAISALSETSSNQKIILTTLQALAQKTIPKKILSEHTVKLFVNQDVESDSHLANQLNTAGYNQIDPVEDPGTFCLRGNIVDIFPVNSKNPYRIELFGDAVETIRPFDSNTQITIRNKTFPKHLSVPPAGEVVFNDETKSNLRKNIKKFSDDNQIHRKIRDPILEAIRLSHPTDHSDAWASFAYENAPSFFDHLDSSWFISWVEPNECYNNYNDFLKKQEVSYSQNTNSPYIVPPPKSLFTLSKAALLFLEKNSIFYFNQVNITDTEGSPLLTKTNDICKIQVPAQPLSLPKASESDHVNKIKSLFSLWRGDVYKVIIFFQSPSQEKWLVYILNSLNIPYSKELNESHSFFLINGSVTEAIKWEDEKLIVLSCDKLYGQEKRSLERGDLTKKTWVGLQSFSDLKPNDLIVHVQHGLGVYLGLKRLNVSGAPNDFIAIMYANDDKLYLPVYRLNAIQKYHGSSDSIKLNRLGGEQFHKTKQRAREAAKLLAIDLLNTQAKRSLQAGFLTRPPDNDYFSFENEFPFTDTPDQTRATNDALSDLSSGKMMDRIICGDVGFGKTEVAMRVAFQMASSGKQVLVLVPTTLLAYQHEITFKSRFSNYPFFIESLSRLKPRAEQKKILEALTSGKIDVLIGTHRLLSKDVQCPNLGLIVVDEEHRFGVEHKEKLKLLKLNTHILSLTATPIPRTLQMSLAKLKDISLMTTPPVNRLPIRTHVCAYDEKIIKEAIDVEISRGGQVFFLYNKVQTIAEFASKISTLVPNAKVDFAHGQMSETALEKVMCRFYSKEFNVLICTTIIESGIDIPNANTIIIYQADRFGLAQLYQLRGRVGRSEKRAYAYLLITKSHTLTQDAKKRLDVIQRFVELGSGFQIASHDLEIRGGGNLLGPEQSGHITAIGFELYMDLLEKEIKKIKLGPQHEDDFIEPEIKSPFSAFLDESYIPDVHQRIALYRRLSLTTNSTQLTELELELQDRFGALPEESQNLVTIIQIKHLLIKYKVSFLTIGKDKVSIIPSSQSLITPKLAIDYMTKFPEKLQITPDSKMIVNIPAPDLSQTYFALEQFLSHLVKN